MLPRPRQVGGDGQRIGGQGGVSVQRRPFRPPAPRRPILRASVGGAAVAECRIDARPVGCAQFDRQGGGERSGGDDAGRWLEGRRWLEGTKKDGSQVGAAPPPAARPTPPSPPAVRQGSAAVAPGRAARSIASPCASASRRRRAAIPWDRSSLDHFIGSWTREQAAAFSVRSGQALTRLLRRTHRSTSPRGPLPAAGR